MKKPAIFTLLLLLTVALSAQNTYQTSPYREIYRLSNREARAALVDGAPFDSAWLHTLIGLSDTTLPARLPPGHYLMVSGEMEHVSITTFTRHAFELNVLPSRRGLEFVLTDSSGRRIPDADVLLSGRKVRFDKKTQVYRIARPKEGRMLEIRVSGQLWFYKIGFDEWKSGSNYRWQLFSMSPVGKVVAVPWIYLKSTPYFVRKLKNRLRYWSYGNYQKQSKWNKQEAWKGYVAFSQPKYRPGDTLQVKAWVTDKKGKPWNKPVLLTISPVYESRSSASRMLVPQAPGVFTWQTVLNDSLEIDKNYRLDFFNPHPRKRGWFKKYRPYPGKVSGNFYYEDYVLDEIRYRFECDKQLYVPGDSIVLHVGAEDATGQPLSDGRYKIVVKTASMEAFYGQEVLMPDTLWQTEGALPPSGKLDLRLPENLLPFARYNLSATLYATNSAGELQTKDLALQVDRRIRRLDARLRDGWLYVDWNDPASEPKRVLFYEIFPEMPCRCDTVSLPIRVKINPAVRSYQVRAGQEFLQITLNDMAFGGHQVSTQSYRIGDTVLFEIQNPHLLPVQYRIWRGKEEWEKGLVTDSVKTLRFSAARAYDWSAQMTFIWGGNKNELTETVPLYKNYLNVSIEQPETVLPGSQVQVKVQVTDLNERPLAGAHLTAGAFNALFAPRKPYEAPEISYKIRRALPENPYVIKLANNAVWNEPMSEKWYLRLHLDTIPYYQFRHIGPASEGTLPEAFAVVTEVFPAAFEGLSPGAAGILPDMPLKADSFYYQKPQVAPFIIRDFKSQPVYLIWLNQRLVYYHGATDNPPYSFFAENGYNSLRIRTRSGEFTLDSIYLEQGKKYALSLCEAGWNKNWKKPAAGGDVFRHARVRWEARPDSLNQMERTTLQKTMLLLRDVPGNTMRYFWQDVSSIHRVGIPKNTYHILGPFSPGRQIDGLLPGGFITRFLFEPGYEYDVLPQRERLYASDWMRVSGRLPRKLAEKSMFNWALGAQHIVPAAPAYRFTTPGIDAPGMGSLRLLYAKKDSILKGIVLRRDTVAGFYSPGTFEWHGLKPGIHHLLVYTQNGALYEQDVQIRRDTMLCLDISDKTFRPAASEVRFEKMFQSVLSNTVPVGYMPAQYRMRPGFGAILQGHITGSDGESLIGAAVKIMKDGMLVAGVVTNVDGYYYIEVDPGYYSMEVSYTGYQTRQTTHIQVSAGAQRYVDNVLNESQDLQEVVVTALGTRRQSIESMLAGQTRGVYAIDGGAVNIKGVRSDSTNYYIDGIRVSGGIPPLSDEQEWAQVPNQTASDDGPPFQVRSAFRDHAYWQPNLTTDAQGEAVFQVRFPDDLTTWDAYAIATDTKKRGGVGKARTRAFKPTTAQLAIPRFAIAGDRFDASGRVVHRGRDSASVVTHFSLNGRVLGENRLRLLQGASEYFPIEIPAGSDSAAVVYDLRSGDTGDGESRKIPVLPVGFLKTEGRFWALEKDTSFLLEFPAGPAPVTLYAESNPLDMMLRDVDYLYKYPYECNEQTASRLMALLSLKKIDAFRKQPFQKEKDIKACFKRLKNSQLPSGAWGWWAGGVPNGWMTAYVAHALFVAQQAGYPVEGLNEALGAVRVLLPAMNPSDQCLALLLLQECRVNIDCTPYLTYYDTLKTPDLSDRLNKLSIMQLCGKEISKAELADSLHRTVFGGIYFGEGEKHWYQRRAVQTLQAYDIARAAGWNDLTRGIERYWLQSRPVQRNTIETAKILERLIPVLLEGQDSLRPVRLAVNETPMEKFPLSMQFDPAQGSALRIAKTGSGPVFLTAYQQSWEAAPAARSDLFEVSSRLLLANGTPATRLLFGESATLEIQVQVKEAADYVMIEAPIPAGCGYGDKVQSGGPEVHREYFKDRTAIFCERMPAGNYIFRIPLEPRFTGLFTLNPVRVEQMYFPVFYGRNEVKKVSVEK